MSPHAWSTYKQAVALAVLGAIGCGVSTAGPWWMGIPVGFAGGWAVIWSGRKFFRAGSMMAWDMLSEKYPDEMKVIFAKRMMEKQLMERRPQA